MAGKNQIIVKKIKKGGHGGHHGGAWKVAYADFVTAMMAFFLLLWLLSMNSDEKRARISTYFKHFSIFTSGGTSFMEKSSSMFRESGPTEQKVFGSNNRGEVLANIKKVEDAFQKKITEALSEGRDQVGVKISRNKIRIQMIDKDGREMFESGSSIMTPIAKEILKAISENIGSLPNEVSVEGHTDSIPLGRENYTNWELSADRAATARRELEANGIDPKRIARISGYADKEPYDKKDPNSTKNRRITVVIDPTIRIKKPIRDEKTGKIVAWKGVDNLTLQKLEEILFKTKEKLKNKSKLPQKSKAVTQEKESWGPIIKKEDWTPVMKDESVNPIISADNLDPVVPGYKWKPVEDAEQISSVKSKNKYTDKIMEEALVAENPSNKEMNGYFDSAIKGKIKVSSPPETTESVTGSSNKIPDTGEADPGVKNNAWGPVIKEDEWNPVIKRDPVNVLQNKYTDKIIAEALTAENPSNKEMNGYFDSEIKGKIKVSSPPETTESVTGSSNKVPLTVESAPGVKGNAWGPVIKRDPVNVLQNKYTDKIIEDSLAAEKPSNKEMNGYFDSVINGKIKVSPPSETGDSAVGSTKKAPVAQDDAPGGNGNEWGHVIKEDEWSPVIKKDDLNILE